jgi:hypothetical protein
MMFRSTTNASRNREQLFTKNNLKALWSLSLAENPKAQPLKKITKTPCFTDKTPVFYTLMGCIPKRRPEPVSINETSAVG